VEFCPGRGEEEGYCYVEGEVECFDGEGMSGFDEG